jgi:hypothetical protein
MTSPQEATFLTLGQFDAAVLEIDAEELEQVAAVEEAMRRLRVRSFQLKVFSKMCSNTLSGSQTHPYGSSVCLPRPCACPDIF